MGKNVHEKRKRLLTKMKAACLAVVMCVSTLPVLTAQIQPVTAYAQEKTGTVNAGVTGLRIRSSTDTSSTANVITKVSGEGRTRLCGKVCCPYNALAGTL